MTIDLVDRIMAYEEGSMDQQDMLRFFQELIDTPGLEFARSLRSHCRPPHQGGAGAASEGGKMKMLTRKFALGQVVATPGALEALEEAGQTPGFFLDLHASGNWGNVGEEDWALNDEALKDGSRILSAYRTMRGRKIWCITEAKDDDGHRAATTLLLPEEY